MTTRLAAFAVILLAARAAHGQSVRVTPPPDFDAYVERVLKTFDVPGAAVTIVKDGRVVLAKGYGVPTIGKPEHVDSNTRLGIACHSNAFTATALAIVLQTGPVPCDA